MHVDGSSSSSVERSRRRVDGSSCSSSSSVEPSNTLLPGTYVLDLGRGQNGRITELLPCISTVLLLLPLNDQEDGAAPDGERDGKPTNDTSPADFVEKPKFAFC